MGSPSEAFGPYLVYEQLGIGGMASVHRAEMGGIEGFRRPVALKRMLPHVAADAEMVQAFVREAHLASHLRHANVAQTYDLGKVGDVYFIAMELITGKSLREILKHCAATTGPMPVAVALNILNQMCDALDYAHNLCDERGKLLGIIHRDVSPSNIIVAHDGVVKLIDFGIAKVTSSSMQTMAGTIKGKFGYMAPEYIAGSIDARADLFALGVIAHELLTNRPLFTGPDDMETLHRVRRMDIMPPSRRNPQVPPEVDDIVMTALSRDPDRRWQHATALRNAMTTVTRRLGLAIHNSQVVDWVHWAFAQRGPLKLSGHTINLEDDDPSISIDRNGMTSITANTNDQPDVSSDQMTMMLMNGVGGSSPNTPLPVGTPSRITAQPGPSPEVAAYREALAAYERGDGQAPNDAMQTLVRPSQPRLARDSGAPQNAPADPMPRASYPGMRTSGLRDAVPGVEPAKRPSAPHVQATLAGVPASSPNIRIPTTPNPSGRNTPPTPNPAQWQEPAKQDPPIRGSNPRISDNIAIPRAATPPRVAPSSPTIIDPAAASPAIARVSTPNAPIAGLPSTPPGATSGPSRLPVAEPLMSPHARNPASPSTPPSFSSPAQGAREPPRPSDPPPYGREARASDPPFTTAQGSQRDPRASDPPFARVGSGTRIELPPPDPEPAPKQGGSALTIVLVLLAAAIAAAAVYFVLPLMT